MADAFPAGEAIDAATPEAAAPDTTPARASVFFETTAEGMVLWLRDAGITASTAHPLLEALLVQAQRAGVRIAGVRINGHPAEASPSLSPTRRNPWPSTA